MAMSVTTTMSRADVMNNIIQKISVAWVSAADGSASGTFEAYGFLVKMVTNPGATAPTADYDITLIDGAGVDALAGTGVDRHTATSQQVYPLVTGAATPVLLYGSHTFTIANAGDSKIGVCDFYVMPRL